MTETLFERYKEALRAGHVAVLRGHLEDAAAAYREAVAIAADRAVPRTALGNVQLRLGEPGAALESYDGALGLAPDDDPSLLGRAQALVVLRRTAEAAVAYDQLAEVRAAGGRSADAAEAARRALAIEPSDERRARHADLVEEIRRAGVAVADGVTASPTTEDASAAAEDAAAVAEEAALAATAGDEPPPSGTRRPGGTPPRATPEPPPPDPEMLIAVIDEAASRGDAGTAAAAALAAARAYRDQGHITAAFDACLQGIGARPADIELHLLLADLAVDRGWTGHAGDTYRSLLRLVELDGDPARREAVRAAAAARLPGDPRFAGG